MKAECCCGNTGVELLGKPEFAAVCHCNDCKKRTGSAFGVSVFYADEAVGKVQGAFKEYVIGGLKAQRRHFCSDCGTTLFWHVDVFEGMTIVAGGCIEGMDTIEPTITTSNDSRCTWVGLPDALKTIEFA